MRFTYTITCLLLFTFLFASCGVIESVEPLSPPETAKRDKRLTGIWAAWGPGGEKDCNLEFWVQFIDGKNPLVDVHLNSLNADDTLFFKMHPTQYCLKGGWGCRGDGSLVEISQFYSHCNSKFRTRPTERRKTL